MNKITKQTRQRAEARSLSRSAAGILGGSSLKVAWLPDHDDQLGFTSGKKKCVYVAWLHEYMKKLSEDERTILRKGIFAHELLHQVLTNFTYTELLVSKMSNVEANIFMTFANTLEDPAIEFFAPKVFGGKLLDSLRFSIKHIYNMSPGIEESQSAFTQLVNALIHFGDMGLVKGEFTYPEAYKYFCLLAPKYNEGIECPDNERRLDIAKECMELSRPLWEKEAKEQEEFEEMLKDFLKSLASEMADAGLTIKDLEDILDSLSSDSDSEDDSSDNDDDKSSSSKRRKTFVKALEQESKSKETANEDGEDSDSSEDSDDSESDNKKPSKKKSKKSDAEEEDKESNSSDNSEKSEKSENSDVKKDEADKRENSPESNNSTNNNTDENADNKTADNSYDTSESMNIDYSHLESMVTASPRECTTIANEEFTIDDATVEKIIEELNRDIESVQKEEAKKSEEANLDFDVESPHFTHASALNHWINPNVSLLPQYRYYVASLNTEITNLVKAMRRLFQQDQTEYLRYTSGRYNIKRGASGTTAKIFDKRKDNGQLDDIVVEILVDESGSMHGPKIAEARKTCIILSEAFAKLDIPCYIIGFRADCKGYDAVHDHYVSWKSNELQRSSLLSMEANGNNFDGYSIRYAGENIKRKNAEHKILFIISDGQPACYVYPGSVGIQDTSDAIRDIRKYATVFGIGIGMHCSEEILQKMYGKDFIHVKNEQRLSVELVNKLKTIVKSFKY